LPIGLSQRLKRMHRPGREARQRLLDHGGDPEESQTIPEEGVDGHLVGGVERAWRSTTLQGGLARQS
jgi:hypothetical protein